MDLGRVGVWSVGLRSDDPAGRGARAAAAVELEELGYGAIWLGGSPGVRHAVPLVEATSRLVVATGILRIWDYEAEQVAREYTDLEGGHPGRFLLGLGVSHQKRIGESYRRPYAAMLDYLDRLDAAGMPAAGRALAALGPKMLAASRDRAAGAHPYLTVPEHTREAREILGPGPLLAPEVKVIFEPDADRARAIARDHLARYLELANYTRSLARLGFTEDDLRGGGSDRLIDALFAHGDLAAARGLVAGHREAGADHVTLQVITDEPLPLREWRALAPLTAD